MGVAEEVEQLELERDEVQELPMLLRPGSVGEVALKSRGSTSS